MVFQKGNKWAIKPGETRNPKGMPKGTIHNRKKVEWTVALMEECLGIDSTTGRKMKISTLKKKFSKVLWDNPKMIMDFLDRKLGKPAQTHIVEAKSYILEGPEDKDVIEAEILGNKMLVKDTKDKDDI